MKPYKNSSCKKSLYWLWPGFGKSLRVPVFLGTYTRMCLWQRGCACLLSPHSEIFNDCWEAKLFRWLIPAVFATPKSGVWPSPWTQARVRLTKWPVLTPVPLYPFPKNELPCWNWRVQAEVDTFHGKDGPKSELGFKHAQASSST